MVKNILGKITVQKIKSDPYLSLLTITELGNYSPWRTLVLTHVIVAVKILYAQHWKSSCVPSEETFFQKIRERIEIDKLTLLLNDKSEQVFKSS